VDPHALQAHRHCQILLAIVEQASLLRRANQMPGQRLRLQSALLIELSKLRYRLLDDAPTNSHAAHKAPIAMDLAVLSPRRVAQVHAPISTQRLSKENSLGRHYTPIAPAMTSQPLDLAQPLPAKKPKRPSFCASWVNLPKPHSGCTGKLPPRA